LSRQGLRRLIALFANVTSLRPGQALPTTSNDYRTRYYQSALAIARLVLAGRSIEQPAGKTTARGFVFDLNRVFELWLTTALTSALRKHEGTLVDQWLGYFDSERRIRLRPDLVWRRHGRPSAVADAKYKRLHASSYPHGDLYQILAYIHVLGLARGHLIYAAGDGHTTTTHTVNRSGSQIQTWSLDLTKPSLELLDDVGAIAAAMAQAR
jgi:5-methylcytosine-specific restriction enzyme subunit McrC